LLLVECQVRNPLSAAIAASCFVTAAVDKIMSTTFNNINSSNAVLSSSSQNGRAEKAPLLLQCEQQHKPQPQQELTVAVQAIREDMIIVDQSLHFINELLKSMLDMHKVANRQIRLSLDALSVRDDVFLPVQGMLYQRDETFKIQIDCPADLVIVGDRLRLQQVVMNLARNAAKFVQRGYIRLRASVIVTTTTANNNSNGNNNTMIQRELVVLHVEDSGPGIPMDKRSNLFQRFQESLDSLNQGTGVGLYLCKKLVDLMDGALYLDESFDSGVEGFPGTRIVVSLPLTRPPPSLRGSSTGSDGSSLFFLDEPTSTDILTPALRRTSLPEQHPCRTKMADIPSRITPSYSRAAQSWEGGQGKGHPNDAAAPGTMTTEVATVDESAGPPLPEALNVLFVDDDRTLRKLARRCLEKLVPEWNVWEASSGEMALSMITSKDEPVSFDIIFMDQYMTTSAGQALKGTETTRQLRALGFRSPIVCGLSANYDSKGPFLNCGADDFWLKPFPCKLPELQRSLQNLMALRDARTSAV
jgi:signal transduction histidine kinase/CheY-like chemotaxis protein